MRQINLYLKPLLFSRYISYALKAFPDIFIGPCTLGGTSQSLCMVLSETFSREKTPYVVLPVPSLFVAIPPFPKLSRPLTYPFYYIQLQMDDLPLQSQQQFNYNNILPGPPGEDDATSQDTRTGTNNGAEKANVWNERCVNLGHTATHP